MNFKTLFINMSGSEGQDKGLLISEAVLLLYGLFLLIFPAKGLNLSVAAVGILFIAFGAFCAYKFVTKLKDGNYPIIAVAVISILVGILCIVFRSSISLVLFPVLLGIWCAITAILAGYAALTSYKGGNGLWWIPFLAFIVAFVITIMVFFNLSGTERFMARLLGLYFITFNVVRLSEFFVAKYAPNVLVVTKTGKKSGRRSSGRSGRSSRSGRSGRTANSENRAERKHVVRDSYEQDYIDEREFDDDYR